MTENENFPIALRPKIRGIENVLEILGEEYVFHDSEVDEVRIKRDGTVVITVWSGWSFVHEGKEYITTWKLNNCVSVDGEFDPQVCDLWDIQVEEEDALGRLRVYMDGVGPAYTCDSIDVSIREYEGEYRQRVYLDMDNVLVDFASGIARLDESVKKEYEGRLDEVPGIFALMDPMPGAIEAVHRLAEKYDVFILSTSPWKNPSAWSDKVSWVTKYLDDVLHKRLILSHNKDLLKGDYLVDDRPKHGADSFEGEWIQFRCEKFPDWKTVLEYLKINS